MSNVEDHLAVIRRAEPYYDADRAIANHWATELSVKMAMGKGMSPELHAMCLQTRMMVADLHNIPDVCLQISIDQAVSALKRAGFDGSMEAGLAERAVTILDRENDIKLPKNAALMLAFWGVEHDGFDVSMDIPIAVDEDSVFNKPAVFGKANFG